MPSPSAFAGKPQNRDQLPVVIGCGNLARSDDGVGCQVIRYLKDQPALSGKVRLLDAGTDGMVVMYAARGASSLTVIDACRGIGNKPGEVFDIPGDAIDNAPPEGINTHALRWDHVVHVARRILGEQFPKDFRVILIEADCIEIGLELTEKVEAAARDVTRRVLSRLEPGQTAPC